MLAKTISLLNGITAHATKAKVRVIIGAKTNIILFALAAIIISLKRYFYNLDYKFFSNSLLNKPGSVVLDNSNS